MIERFKNNPYAMKEVGLNYATYQIIDLITNGVDGIHLLNQLNQNIQGINLIL